MPPCAGHVRVGCCCVTRRRYLQNMALTILRSGMFGGLTVNVTLCAAPCLCASLRFRQGRGTVQPCVRPRVRCRVHCCGCCVCVGRGASRARQCCVRVCAACVAVLRAWQCCVRGSAVRGSAGRWRCGPCSCNAVCCSLVGGVSSALLRDMCVIVARCARRGLRCCTCA